MGISVYLLGFFIINGIIGSAVCSLLDTKDKVWFKWYSKDPTGGLGCALVITLWPITAFFIIKYRKNI